MKKDKEVIIVQDVEQNSLNQTQNMKVEGAGHRFFRRYLMYLKLKLILWLGLPEQNIIVKNYKKTSLIDKYEKFISENGIEIAGIEYIKDENEEIYTYDVNTNTNYNSIAEKDSKIKGMRSIAEFLKKELLLLSNIKVVA